MKTSAKQSLEGVISDNKSFIKAYSEDGNIKEYFEGDLENDPNAHYFYLTDEEREEWDMNPDSHERLITPVHELLDQYDISIDEYIGKCVDPAY